MHLCFPRSTALFPAFIFYLILAVGPMLLAQETAFDRAEAGRRLLDEGVAGLRGILAQAGAPPLTFDQETQVQSVHADHVRAYNNMLAANGGQTESIQPGIRQLEEQLFLAALKFLNPAQRGDLVGELSAAELAALNSDLPEDPDELREYLSDLRSPAGGGNNNLQVDGFGGGRLPDRDEIQEIRINENSFTAEQSSHGRGQTQILTRGGTGSYNGDANFNFRDESLDARNALANSRPPYQRRNFNTNLSGPVIRNVLTLTLGLQHNTSENGDSLFALTPNGFVDDAITSGGTSKGYSTRGTAQLSSNHVLNASYNHQNQEEQNQNVSGIRLPSQGSFSEGGSRNVQIKETAILSGNWNNEAQFQYQRFRRSQLPNTTGLHFDVSGTLRTGGSQQDFTFQNTQYEFSDLLMYTGSRMAMRIGFQGNQVTNWSDSRNNYFGTYRFSTLYDYCGVVLGFVGSQCQIALAGREADKAQFEMDNPSEVLDITPTAESYSVSFGESVSEVSSFFGATFVQTDFRVRNDLTLSVGARYEWQSHLDDNNNLDPRFGFAYQLGSDTVLRGGTGVFHSRLDAQEINNLARNDGTGQQTVRINNPSYPNPFLTGEVQEFDPLLAEVVVRASELAAPYTWHSEVSIETSFDTGLVLTGSYRFIRGLHLFRQRNLNAPFPECTAFLPSTASDEQIASCRPDPTRGNVMQFESTGTSNDHRVRLGFRQRLSFLNINGSYEFGSQYDDVATPVNSYDQDAEWARDGRRHQFNTSVNFRLPWNVNMDTRMDWQSGNPYTLRTGRDDNLDTQNNDRPAGVGRNTLTGPGFFEIDMQLSKSIQLFASAVETEGGTTGPIAGGGYYGGRTGVRMTLSATVTNLLNTTNVSGIGGVISNERFFEQPTSVRNPRQIQAQVRFNF